MSITGSPRRYELEVSNPYPHVTLTLSPRLPVVDFHPARLEWGDINHNDILLNMIMTSDYFLSKNNMYFRLSFMSTSKVSRKRMKKSVVRCFDLINPQRVLGPLNQCTLILLVTSVPVKRSNQQIHRSTLNRCSPEPPKHFFRRLYEDQQQVL